MRFEGLVFDEAPRITLWGHHRSRRLSAIAAVCMLALVAHMAWLGLQMAQLVHALNAASEKILAVQATLAPLQKPRPKAEVASLNGAAPRDLFGATVPPASLDAFNAVVVQLSVPWHDIFEQLEQATPPEVALLGMEPDGQRRQIRLQAEAASLDALLRYAASLQNQGAFGRLNYSKHETNAQDPNRPVRLSFELGLATPVRLTEGAP